MTSASDEKWRLFSFFFQFRLAVRQMNRSLFPTTPSIPSYDIGKYVALRSYQHHRSSFLAEAKGRGRMRLPVCKTCVGFHLEGLLKITGFFSGDVTMPVATSKRHKSSLPRQQKLACASPTYWVQNFRSGIPAKLWSIFRTEIQRSKSWLWFSAINFLNLQNPYFAQGALFSPSLYDFERLMALARNSIIPMYWTLTVWGLITDPLKGGTVQIFGNNVNKSKFYSARN